jgi:hypothetical protein
MHGEQHHIADIFLDPINALLLVKEHAQPLG